MSDGIQHTLFESIKKILPEHTLLSDAIASALSISPDAAYRRITGKSALTLHETHQLLLYFRLSYDQVFHNLSSHYTFYPISTSRVTENLAQYIHDIDKNLFLSQRIIYAAKDIPFFYLGHSREIVGFKLFLWYKSFMQVPEYKDLKFSIASISPSFEHQGKEVYNKFQNIPTTEIWNQETLNSFLHQVEYYVQCNYFQDPAESLLLLDQLTALMQQIETQAQQGKKKNALFEMYYNDILLLDNSLYSETPQASTAYILYNTIHYMMSRDPLFTQEVGSWLKNQISKSQLISSTAEKTRNQLFQLYYKKIELSKEKIKTMLADQG